MLLYTYGSKITQYLKNDVTKALCSREKYKEVSQMASFFV